MTAKEYLESKGLNDHDYMDSGMINHISEMMEEYHQAKQLLIHSVINWVACKDVKPINGKEYLISDSEDVTEAQWYDDSKWGGEPYDSYTHYAEKPKPPCL
jgi:hypothetical protein